VVACGESGPEDHQVTAVQMNDPDPERPETNQRKEQSGVPDPRVPPQRLQQNAARQCYECFLFSARRQREHAFSLSSFFFRRRGVA